MRLYLADIPTRQGSLPAVKFFWNAFSRTSIFSKITSDPDSALAILRQRPASQADSTWHREWRTILLFLELYIFVLRLTDDDDFFSGLSLSPHLGDSTSRLRSSGLSLQELKRLTLFLKHLGFTLYYNAADLVDSTSRALDAADDSSVSSSRPRRAAGKSRAAGALSFTLTAGVDFEAFRNLVATAMRMLYERDSRRQFLPQKHWLMTSKFDMEGFLSAVVLEEQSQREQAEADDGDEDEDDEMDVQEPHVALSAGGLRLSRQAQMERTRVARKRAARDNLTAAAGPKLEILRNMPFVIPFDMRVQIFRQFVHLDKHRRRGGNIDPDRWRLWVLNQHGGPFEPTAAGTNIIGRHQAQIQRGQIFHDAMDSFWDLNEGLKEPIQITFVDEFGMPEAGIDGGGVTKEFLTSVTTEAFAPTERLFVANSKNSYYPNPCDMDQSRNTLREAQIPEDSPDWAESITYRLRQYEFLGRVIGKCLYEGILIDIVFAGFFLLKWATSAGAGDTYRANINDLRELDEELYQGMLRLKNYPGDVGDLSLDFTITDQISLPGDPFRTVTRNLVPNGENIPVTNENRPLYISYVARHRLVVQPYAQTRAFLRGLGMLIDPGWLSMFNQNELQRLVGGDSSEIDVEDLRKHTVYSGVYAIGDDGEEHPTVQLFWEVMHGLEDRERRDVLKYVTSTPRAPLLGFSQLSPPFSIRDGGMDQERLPSASTCVNLLKLPQYQSAAGLKKKLLYAVTSGAGFDLS
jgi:ubiquitin-protein ligase E3 C